MSSKYIAQRIMFSSMNVTMLVWRVMGCTTTTLRLLRKHTFCIHVIRSQPFFVLNTYMGITIIHKPNAAGMIRYSGFVTTTPFSISGGTP